jgi:ribonuclease HI
MQLFFYGISGEQRPGGWGLANFTIPDTGIFFRARFKGNQEECEYAALLALLEFVEINPKLFKKRKVEIFGDSFTVVHQVNQKMLCGKALEPYRNMALLYKKKIDYSLSWIPKNENPATAGGRRA